LGSGEILKYLEALSSLLGDFGFIGLFGIAIQYYPICDEIYLIFFGL
jgi:hypothetical protein